MGVDPWWTVRYDRLGRCVRDRLSWGTDMGGGFELGHAFRRVRLNVRAGIRSIADPAGGNSLPAWSLGGGVRVGAVHVDVVRTKVDAGIEVGTGVSATLDW